MICFYLFTNCITTIIVSCVTPLYVRKIIEQCAIRFKQLNLFVILHDDCVLPKPVV